MKFLEGFLRRYTNGKKKHIANSVIQKKGILRQLSLDVASGERNNWLGVHCLWRIQYYLVVFRVYPKASKAPSMKSTVFAFCFALSLSTQGQGMTVIKNDTGQNRLIHFLPDRFSNKFSLNVPPILRIHSGDTVITETVDAAGYDKQGVKRQKGGNPLTGPFYIEEAQPGDILAIHLNRVSLNRQTAFTTENFVARSVPKPVAEEVKKIKLARWTLDIQNGFAYPDSPYQHLRNFKVPLKPFLGCIGLAPLTKNNEILSFFSGAFGGNLDFERVAQSATIYLPVFHEGAFLYIGDGHAAQGDGEIAGNALETSMDIEFTVKLIKKKGWSLSYPRLEDTCYLMAMGLDKSLDKAIKNASSGLLDWLETDFHLSLREATQVMSTSIEYRIAEIADPEVEIVAMIKKEILKSIKRDD
jgi:amidase